MRISPLSIACFGGILAMGATRAAEPAPPDSSDGTSTPAPLLLQEFRHQDLVRITRVNPDGTRIVTASGKTALVWDVSTGRPIGRPLLHPGEVMVVQISPDGRRALTAGGSTAAIWNLQASEPVGGVISHHDQINHAEFSPDGRLVATASADGTARVWDGLTGHQVGPPIRHPDGKGFAVDSAKFSRDSGLLLTISEVSRNSDSKISMKLFEARLWEARTGRPVGGPAKHWNRIYYAELGPDNKRLVTSDYEYGYLWDAQTGKRIREPIYYEGAGPPFARLSPDGKRMLTKFYDAPKLWDASTGRFIGGLGKPDFSASPLIGPRDTKFSPDGKGVVLCTGKGADLWDLRTGKRIGRSMPHQAPPDLALFSPDGLLLATRSGRVVQTWNTQTGMPLGTPMIHDEEVQSMQLSPDGASLLTRHGRSVQVWMARTGMPVGHPLSHPHSVNWTGFSRNGTLVLTSAHRTVRVFEVRPGDGRGALPGKVNGKRPSVPSP